MDKAAATESFTALAKRRKLKAEVRDRIIAAHNWTGDEQVTADDYEAIVAADAEAVADVEPSDPADAE